MEEKLRQIGLSKLEAKAYLYLLDYSAGRKPRQITEALGITRTNVYKVLESLEQMNLIRRSTASPTLTYFAENPIALTNFIAEARNHARQLESTVKDSLQSLQKRYQKNVRHSEVQVAHGRSAILQAHKKQIKPDGVLYFIKSRADISFMGFEEIRRIRYEPSKNGMQRFGITPNSKEVDPNPAADKRTNLTRTLIPEDQYTSTVEWTVSGDELAIIRYSDSGSAIRIRDAEIAEAFQQIWKLIADNH